MKKRQVVITLNAELFAEDDEAIETLVASSFAHPPPHMVTVDVVSVTVGDP